MPQEQNIGYPTQPALWQGASPWGPRPVGLGSEVFGRVGCVVVSVAMALRFLGVRAGATPLDVQAAGLLRTGVWAPGSSGCVVPALVRAQTDLEVGQDLHGAGKVASVDELRPMIVDALTRGGVVLLAVDYDRDMPKGDPTAEHWGCAYAIERQPGHAPELLLADPATAKTERLPLGSLSSRIKWGRVTRHYRAVRGVSVFRG